MVNSRVGSVTWCVGRGGLHAKFSASHVASTLRLCLSLAAAWCLHSSLRNYMSPLQMSRKSCMVLSSFPPLRVGPWRLEDELCHFLEHSPPSSATHSCVLFAVALPDLASQAFGLAKTERRLPHKETTILARGMLTSSLITMKLVGDGIGLESFLVVAVLMSVSGASVRLSGGRDGCCTCTLAAVIWTYLEIERAIEEQFALAGQFLNITSLSSGQVETPQCTLRSWVSTVPAVVR